VSEKLVRDDEDAREILKDLREKILNAETIFTDYLITGKIQKPN
jgi:CHASE3 domain sensor protein